MINNGKSTDAQEPNYYTYCGETETEAIVREDLRHISAFFNREFPHYSSLFIIGSMGRGEGVVCRSGGRYMVMSDYDLVAVSEKKGRDAAAVHRRLIKFSEEIGRFCHAITLSKRQLAKVKPSLSSYELKNGSQLLQGNPKLLELIPEFDPSRISHDGFFSTAPWQLLSIILNYAPRQGVDVGLWRNHMASKLLISVLTIKLLAKGQYALSVGDKIAMFEKLYPDLKDPLIFEWLPAVRENIYAADLSDDMVNKIRRFYLDTLLEFISRKYGRAFSDWLEFTGFYVRDPRWIVRRAAYGRHPLLGDVNDRRLLDPALLLLLASCTDSGIDERLFSGAVSLLKRIRVPGSDKNSWNDVALNAVTEWSSRRLNKKI